MSQGLTQNEQTILKKKHPKDQTLFIFFHLIIKLHLRLRVATIKKASCARLQMRRTFELRSCECNKSKQVASHALVIIMNGVRHTCCHEISHNVGVAILFKYLFNKVLGFNSVSTIWPFTTARNWVIRVLEIDVNLCTQGWVAKLCF